MFQVFAPVSKGHLSTTLLLALVNLHELSTLYSVSRNVIILK